MHRALQIFGIDCLIIYAYMQTQKSYIEKHIVLKNIENRIVSTVYYMLLQVFD